MNSELVASLKTDPHAVLSQFFAQHRMALRRVIARRLDKRVLGRVDPSDIVQDTLSEAFVRLDEYLENPQVPFLNWLMFLADQQAKTARRKHVQTQKRSVAREEPIGDCDDGLIVLQQIFKSDSTDPGERVRRGDMLERLNRAIATLTPDDQEIVRLRFLEERPLQDIADLLGLSNDAVSKRAVRSMKRLARVAKQMGIDDVSRH